MRVPRSPHRWQVTPKRAIEIQKTLAGRIIRRGTVPRLRLVAGADVAFTADMTACIAGVVVWDVAARQVVEQHVVLAPVRFPYVPGLLTFRETPAVLAAIRKISREPDAFIFDGQGLAHPRRIGFAAHTGLILDRPSIGCAKSLLIGDFDDPAACRGSTSPLMHEGEIIGAALRTRDQVKPVFVSIGHRLSLKEAIRITVACCDRCRLPEPTRLADVLVGQAKRSSASPVGSWTGRRSMMARHRASQTHSLR